MPWTGAVGGGGDENVARTEGGDGPPEAGAEDQRQERVSVKAGGRRGRRARAHGRVAAALDVGQVEDA